GAASAGLQPSDMSILAAGHAMGKTIFVLNVAQNAAKKGNTVGIFSLEMSKEQLFLRLLTSEAMIDAHKFRTGYLTEKDYGKLSHALGTLADLPIYIDDTPGIGLLEMRAKCRRLAAAHTVELVIVDS